MRHRRNTNHLSRNAPHARLLLRNLAVSVFTHQQVTTTLANAKAARPLIERVITLGKAGDLTARRHVISLLGNVQASRRVFKDLAPLFAARHGGYTRIIRLGTRRGDGADLALLELTERVVVAPPPTTTKKRQGKTPTTASAEPATPKLAAPPKPTAAPPIGTAEQPPVTKPRKLFDGLRKLWDRRQGDRGGSGRG